jgi:tetratricopeptide (TPR) repeat protein
MRLKTVFKEVSWVLVLTIAGLFWVVSAGAKAVSYVREYTYQASEADSKLSCRTIALEQVKRLLLEELGTFLLSETTVKDSELTKDQVTSYTAGLVATVIMDEKWDGKTYAIKAKMTADPDQMAKSIKDLRKDREQSGLLVEMRQKTVAALREIDRLRTELSGNKGSKLKEAEDQYAKAVEGLNAMDWFQKGYVLRYKTKNNEGALKAFSRAIDMDPGLVRAYAGRAAIYNEWRQYTKGLAESEKAIKLDPALAWGFNCRGVAHIGLGEPREAITDLNRALTLTTEYVWPHVNLSWAYFMLKEYQQALDNANKAIELDRDFSHAHFRKGRALDGLKRYPEAIQAFDKAIELDPTFAWSHLQRGHTLIRMDRTEQGLEDIRKAARLGNHEAQNFLTRKKVEW